KYMKGHPTITVSDADETTNLSVFSVGRITAMNPGIFREIDYDGRADVALISISSKTGKFGGLYTGNASYLDSRGITGVYAPDVAFAGPVVIGNISGADSAQAVLLLGSAADVRVSGGNLRQLNSRP